MKITLIAACLGLSVLAAQTDLPVVRRRFAQAVNNETMLRSFAEDLKGERMPEVAGYRAVAQMMMAKSVFSPVAKLRYFTSGRDLLEAAISSHPRSSELRLLRLSVQREVPAILGYSHNIDDDIAFLRANFDSLKDRAVQGLIADYFSGNKIV